VKVIELGSVTSTLGPERSELGESLGKQHANGRRVGPLATMESGRGSKYPLVVNHSATFNAGLPFGPDHWCLLPFWRQQIKFAGRGWCGLNLCVGAFVKIFKIGWITVFVRNQTHWTGRARSFLGSLQAPNIDLDLGDRFDLAVCPQDGPWWGESHRRD
jgi:hypothetical protein